MAKITDYATLQSEALNVLNRADLTDDMPLMVQLAEGRLRRDERTRKLQATAFSINADGDTFPSDFDSIQSLYLDGPTYYGRIETVDPGGVAGYSAVYGPTGVPRVVAVVEGVARYGPAPDGTYAAKLTYWRKITALSDSNTTNWLLLDSPDVYLFAVLLELSLFLKDDERAAVWQTRLDEALNALDAETTRKQFAGRMVRRGRVIGG